MVLSSISWLAGITVVACARQEGNHRYTEVEGDGVQRGKAANLGQLQVVFQAQLVALGAGVITSANRDQPSNLNLLLQPTAEMESSRLLYMPRTRDTRR